MMARTSDGALLTDKHRRAQVRLAITADSQARRIWDSTLDPNDLKRTQPIWKNAILQLLQTWWRISAQTAKDYLPRFREAETGDGGFEIAMPRFDRRQAAQNIDWTGATNVLWHIARGETQEAAYAAARSLFLGIFHEAVLTGGRTTIENWAKKDTRAVGWRRVSDGDPCAFCAMLVTRGPVYTSDEKAGLRASDGHKYHPHCGCTVEIVYGDWRPTEREQQWIDEYYRAAESLPSKTPRTAETVLPLMRRNGQFRDSSARRSAPEFLAARRANRMAGKIPNVGNVRTSPNGATAVLHSDGYWVETGANPSDAERTVAKRMTELGHDVTFRKPADEQNVKTPDFYIDGESWELKTLHGSGKNTVLNALTTAKKQAPRIILDITDCPKPIEQIVSDCESKLQRPNSRIREIILYKDGAIERRLKGYNKS